MTVNGQEISIIAQDAFSRWPYSVPALHAYALIFVGNYKALSIGQDMLSISGLVRSITNDVNQVTGERWIVLS